MSSCGHYVRARTAVCVGIGVGIRKAGKLEAQLKLLNGSFRGNELQPAGQIMVPISGRRFEV